MNNQNEITKKLLFTIALTRNIRINLTKEIRGLYPDNFKMPLKILRKT